MPTSVLALPVLEISLATPPAPFTNTLPLGRPWRFPMPWGSTPGLHPPRMVRCCLSFPMAQCCRAVGRSADGEWIQVRLPDDQLAWMARAVVNVSDNIDTTPADGVTAGEPRPHRGRTLR